MNKKNTVDLSGIQDIYSVSLDRHGVQSAAVGWGDAEAHRLRFDKLATVLAEDTKPISLNDLGCGYGALYEYLVTSGKTIARYRGHDICRDMLEEARKRLTGQAVQLIETAELDTALDYGFACGIFNVRLKETEEHWLDHIKRTLANLNAFSERGFAFNMLSTYVDYRENHLYYGDPMYFFDLCKREFSSSVSLLHDYPLYEWTITVKK